MGRRRSSSSRSSERIERRRSNSRSPVSRNAGGARLHVADIDNRLTEKDLEKAFQKFGPLEEVWMAKTTPCFGFVVFESKEDARDAVDAMNGHTLGESRLRVTFALPRAQAKVRSPMQRSNLKCYQCGKRGHFLRDCGSQKDSRSHFSRRSRSYDRRRRMSRSLSRSRSRSRRGSGDRLSGRKRRSYDDEKKKRRERRRMDNDDERNSEGPSNDNLRSRRDTADARAEKSPIALDD